MTKLQLIQTEIETLTDNEFTYLKNWINELDAQQWENQIEGSLGIMVINKTNQRKRQEASYVNCQNW